MAATVGSSCCHGNASDVGPYGAGLGEARPEVGGGVVVCVAGTGWRTGDGRRKSDLEASHRVRNVPGEVRYAIPFFCDPNHDTMIECLPNCRSAEKPAKYPPIRFGDYALW